MRRLQRVTLAALMSLTASLLERRLRSALKRRS